MRAAVCRKLRHRPLVRVQVKQPNFLKTRFQKIVVSNIPEIRDQYIQGSALVFLLPIDLTNVCCWRHWIDNLRHEEWSEK